MRRLVVHTLVSGLLTSGIACQKSAGPSTDRSTASTSGTSPVGKSANPTTTRPRIVFLGDSLTAGLGLPVDQSYPSLIQRRMDDGGYRYDVVNAGVSGDTSAGGLRRLEWSLDGDVQVLLVALGGNDALRGLPASDLKKNLVSVVEAARARGITVVLAGMEAPPNNGGEYTKQFHDVYVDVARRHNVRLIPFLLDGVAGDPSLNQADGIHPNTRGAQIVADLVWRSLEPVLKRQ